jgi:hypothetical protein
LSFTPSHLLCLGLGTLLCCGCGTLLCCGCGTLLSTEEGGRRREGRKDVREGERRTENESLTEEGRASEKEGFSAPALSNSGRDEVIRGGDHSLPQKHTPLSRDLLLF